MNNINISGRYSCTGCSSCKVVCPSNAIEMKLSNNGFLVPQIDDDKCTNCGICTKVCYKYYDLKKIRVRISMNVFTGLDGVKIMRLGEIAHLAE